MKEFFIAGWRSLAARPAHNRKVTGSNPVPATTLTEARLGRLLFINGGVRRFSR